MAVKMYQQLPSIICHLESLLPEETDPRLPLRLISLRAHLPAEKEITFDFAGTHVFHTGWDQIEDEALR